MSRVLRQPVLDPTPLQLGEPGRPSSEVLSLIEEATEMAYQRGLVDGRTAAHAEVESMVDEARRTIAGAVETEIARLQDGIEHLAPDIIRLATQIAEAVLGHAAHDDGDALERRIAAALGQIDDSTLTITVAPDDVERMRTVFADQATVNADPRLEPGEAMLAGRWAAADLTRRALLDAVERAFDD